MTTTTESLIESLQSHLAHHSTLLPQLHAQLGLPTSELTQEFEQLQRTLCDVVEQQITTRQEEVEAWMEKCGNTERECTRLAKALGGNGTRGLQSVGELRKIQVLPQRYQQVATHHERLSALYQTKIEQLATLTNRLTNLTRTLGTSFFPADVFNPPSIATDDKPTPISPTSAPESTPSTSHPTSQPSSTSPSLNDVTPERFQRLEKELIRGKSEIQKRLVHLASTLELIVWLYTELGIPLPTPDVSAALSSDPPARPGTPILGAGPTVYGKHAKPSVSAGAIPLLSDESSAGESELPQEVTYEQILARFVARWEEAEDEALEGDTLGVEGVDPTVAVMEWAEKLKNELDDLKTLRESQIQTMYDQLESLWRRLGVPDEEIDAFVDGNKGSADTNVQAYEAELARMLTLKKDRMSVFIVNAREEIEALWEDLILSEVEREEFVAFQDDEHTEELLARHEEEIVKLKEERRVKGPILASITKYFDICEEERQLTESAADQSRLLGRGPRGDPGRLLREEKMRKRVKKEKPRLEQELLQTIPDWEERYHRHFLINGLRVVDVLMEGAEAEASKENKKKPSTGTQPRQTSHSIPSRATTPSGPAQAPSTGKKHAMTPSTTQGSQAKRQKLNTGGSVTRPTSAASMNATAPRQQTVPLGTSSVVNAGKASHVTSTGKSANTPASTTRTVSSSMSGMKTYGANLGLGVPTSGRGGARNGSGSMPAVQQSAGRAASGSYRLAAPVTKKKEKRESFKPRTSMDTAVFGMGGLKNLGRTNVGGGLPGLGVGMGVSSMVYGGSERLVEEEEGV